MMRRFAVLDRDGTLIKEKHYLSDPAQVELLPGTAAALRQLRELGLGLVVITNQSGVGRGFYSVERVAQVHERMTRLLESEGVALDAIYFCPHTPDDNCLCRKPRPGLLIQAAHELHFDPGQCFVVGDKACDIELGRQVGAETFLVRTGYGASEEATTTAQHVVDTLLDAAAHIALILG